MCSHGARGTHKRVTDELVSATEAASKGLYDENSFVERIQGPHARMLEELEGRGCNVKEARQHVSDLLEACKELLVAVSSINRRTKGGVVHESTRDAILCFGERLSAPIVAAALGCHTRETLVRTVDEGKKRGRSIPGGGGGGGGLDLIITFFKSFCWEQQRGP